MSMTLNAPSKQAKRELLRWSSILRLKEAGLSVSELAVKFDVSETQVYALLKNAREAREKGWI